MAPIRKGNASLATLTADREPSNVILTPHQEKVYLACQQIPIGYYSTYAVMARYCQSSPRAVGQALGKNPFPSSQVPCHRVLASDGRLCGYAGSRNDASLLQHKEKLLVSEGLEFDKGVISSNLRETRLFTAFRQQ